MRIKYIGKKDSRADTVAGTGIVWLGHGDVHDVPDSAAAKLLRHADVWAVDAADAPTSTAGLGDAKKPPADGDTGSGGNGGETLTEAHFAAMTDEQLRAFAKERDIKGLHHKWTGEKLRAEVWAGLSKKA